MKARLMPGHRRNAGGIVSACWAMPILWLAFSIPASAAEPDDVAVLADGPLQGGITYQGDIASFEDNDWYVFYAGPHAQFQLTLEYVEGGPCSPEVELLDGWGDDVLDRGRAEPDPSESPVRFGVQGPSSTTRYLIHIFNQNCGSGEDYPSRYAFRLESPQAIVPGMPLRGTVQPIIEPNESASQAFGPLVGGAWYGGVFETVNDREFLRFAGTGVPFDVSIGSLASGTSPGRANSICRVSAELDANQIVTTDNTHLDDYAAAIGRLRDEPRGEPRDYVLRLHNASVGCRWQIRIDPPGAVAVPSVTKGSACQLSKTRVSIAKRRLRRAVRRLRKAEGRGGRATARIVVKTRRRQLRQARGRRSRACESRASMALAGSPRAEASR